MTAGAVVPTLAASVIRQSLVPMAAFYLIFMVVLGLGLRGLRRQGARPARAATGTAGPPGGPGTPGEQAGPPGGPGTPGEQAGPPGGPAAVGGRRGWAALARYVLVTVVCGYLVLLAVAVGYYYGVARVGGAFLTSVITGPALLIGLALPVFAAASWAYERVHARYGRPAGRVR